ncbi:MAG: 50S ribosomal protein L31e [Thaumarchaeota archaeon]|nr:50S ribosomal protein L31e [Nitrososphaerota archaeon]
MSDELERIYTINLGKVLLSPNNRRSKRAINVIKDFVIKHTHNEQVKIDKDLNLHIWKNGMKNPPRRIKIKVTTTEKGDLLISNYIENAKTIDTKSDSKY